MNRTIAMLVLIASVLLGLGWGVRQYGNTRVGAQELSTVKGAVQEAVAARDSAVAVDVSQAKENAAKAQQVRSVLIPARKKNAAIQAEVQVVCADAVGDAERIRLLNDAIRSTNRVIATSGIMPE